MKVGTAEPGTKEGGSAVVLMGKENGIVTTNTLSTATTEVINLVRGMGTGNNVTPTGVYMKEDGRMIRWMDGEN